MPIINLVDGEKGGIGKSLFACCLCHYYESHGINYALVDADLSNPDVSNLYGGMQDIHFKASDEITALNSRSAAKVDCIFEMAFEQSVVVNLPANVHEQVAFWILDNALLEGESVQQGKVRIGKWFLTNGSYSSISLFLNSLETYGGKLTHILVRNCGLSSDWEGMEQRQDFQEAKKRYGFEEIPFPGLRATERDYLEQNKLSFSRAMQEQQGLQVLSRQRLVKFVRQTVEAIEVGLKAMETGKKERRKQEEKQNAG